MKEIPMIEEDENVNVVSLLFLCYFCVTLGKK